MKANTGRKWFWRIIDFINPLRDPSLTVAVVLTFIEEAGQHDAWYWIVVIALINWVAVRGVVWLAVNFTFASVFIWHRVWWAIRHPRLAWRILDAVGHEEIVIGGLTSLTEGVLLPDGSTVLSMSPALGASGIHVIGELPAGTEIPMLSMPNGQMAPNLAALAGSSGISGLSTGVFPTLPGQPAMGFPQMGSNGFANQQTTGGFPQGFPQRSSEEEERLREQLATFSRLLDDWIQFTEEKWRTVSDSQLGWKPLRGRWGSWDDIFRDAFAAQTSDPMAQAAQAAGEATARRFDFSKDKGSAASAVACFLRDMMTLRQGVEMMQLPSDTTSETPDTGQPVIQPRQTQSYTRGGFGSSPARNPLIRHPSPIYVDADSD
ncbi:MAG TPA: hypothetical protein VKB35_04555 [Ktedonobacteraceae bacterium]|nr:hypothetical protein [Ktedonobacteraceae bacterium]